MSEDPNQQGRGGEIFDDPNRQAVGLEPAWVEGTGGSEGDTPTPQRQQQSAEGQNLDEMTKGDLLAYAQDIGVKPANNDMTKDELRAGIDAKLAEGG